MRFEYAPRYVIASVPFLWNSFGRFLTLQDASGTKLLPKLVSLTERTTNELEDYDVYRQQTHFRFCFFGQISPRIFRVPVFPPLSLRLLHAPAMRFPTTLLQHTERLEVKDFVDLEDFFPFMQLEPPHLIALRSAAQEEPYMTPIQTSECISRSVTTIACTNEDFAYHLPEDEFFHYLHLSITTALQQFPNLEELHLPARDAFWQSVEGRGTERKEAYMKAIRRIIAESKDERLRGLKVHFDQKVSW